MVSPYFLCCIALDMQEKGQRWCCPFSLSCFLHPIDFFYTKTSNNFIKNFPKNIYIKVAVFIPKNQISVCLSALLSPPDNTILIWFLAIYPLLHQCSWGIFGKHYWWFLLRKSLYVVVKKSANIPSFGGAWGGLTPLSLPPDAKHTGAKSCMWIVPCMPPGLLPFAWG